MYNILKFDSHLIKFFEENSGLSRVISIIHYHEQYLKLMGDYIKVDTDSFDTISYIPKSKLNLPHLMFDEVKHRTKIKIGRFVTKFIKNEAIERYSLTNSDVEIFVNLFKSYFNRDESKLKVISGNEILHYYLDTNYHAPNGSRMGTLWNSCMRYETKNSYMKMYAANVDKIKMLILLDDNNKVKTRALLWQGCTSLDGGQSYDVMDRIYSVYDHDVVLFKEWATKNGYLYKAEQSAYSEDSFIDKNGHNIFLSLKINLESVKFKYYPYLDTFKYFSLSNKTLSNSKYDNYSYILIQNDGGLNPETSDDDDVMDDDD